MPDPIGAAPASPGPGAATKPVGRPMPAPMPEPKKRAPSASEAAEPLTSDNSGVKLAVELFNGRLVANADDN
ncbi:hypothetical protein D3C78_1872370 [compost metagenome]